MSTLEKAIVIAARAHAGQFDKAGNEYILHPLRVMFSVTDPLERMAAILHDVVEDSEITLKNLRDEGFDEDVVKAVDALTKRAGENRMDAAKRAAENSIAIRVKIADVTDNMDLTRIANPTEKDHMRLKEYTQVKKFLESYK